MVDASKTIDQCFKVGVMEFPTHFQSFRFQIIINGSWRYIDVAAEVDQCENTGFCNNNNRDTTFSGVFIYKIKG